MAAPSILVGMRSSSNPLSVPLKSPSIFRSTAFSRLLSPEVAARPGIVNIINNRLAIRIVQQAVLFIRFLTYNIWLVPLFVIIIAISQQLGNKSR